MVWNNLTLNKKYCIINKNIRSWHMKPRIFVSSTFYDLKYVREDLANFIRSHDFEPIMFEDGDIGYDSGKPLDASCYDAMKNADMVILIIGGQYGTNATCQEDDNLSEFISITHREFKTAVDSGIPIFAFVDGKVNAEFEIYKNNIDNIESAPDFIKFSATKDHRVFKFINNIYKLGTIPINDFNKISEIKEILAKQWSDMFKKYLTLSKDNIEIETIKSSVAKLESMIDKISVMMEAVGKNVLTEPNEYNTVINIQRAQQIYRFLEKNLCFGTSKPIHEDILIKSLKEIGEILKKHKGKNIDTLFTKIGEYLFYSEYDIWINRLTNEFIYKFEEIADYLEDEKIMCEFKKLLKEKSFKGIVEYT